MNISASLQAAYKAAIDATRSGAPAAPSNPFFGVGPISDGSLDEVNRRQRKLAFERWIEATYRKRDDNGRDLGGYTVTELARSMHRGEPADSILLDMMRAIHGYFGFPEHNRMAIGLGGGHTGFTVCLQHMLSLTDPRQHVYVDTPAPETEASAHSGFFRQSWATQVFDLCRLSKEGTTERLHFAPSDGTIPSAKTLTDKGIRLFIGVGHETTGASTYSTAEITGLLEWLEADPTNHHAIIDATSLLGAMPWPDEVVSAMMSKCCLFMPLQKAIGGVAGYYVASFTPQARQLIENNLTRPSWAIARQLSLSVPSDPSRPVSGKRTLEKGPFFDATQGIMLGGVINTYSLLAFAETTFGLRELAAHIGPMQALNARSTANRARIEAWVAREPLFELVVPEPEKRGTAVTLLKVNDPDVADLHSRILAKAKLLLGHQGLTHVTGEYEPGLRAACYINAFPGMPGDFRAWIGGVRTIADIEALLNSLRYAWLRAKVCVLAEELTRQGAPLPEAPWREAAKTGQQESMEAINELGRLSANLSALLAGMSTPDAVQKHRANLQSEMEAFLEAAKAYGFKR